jgi:hypothetical protein
MDIDIPFHNNLGTDHYDSGYGSTTDVDYWAVTIVTDSGGMDDYYIYDALCASPNWDQSHIQFLLNERATKPMIIESLAWLKEHADENDIVVFSFQGHGACEGTYWKGTYGIVPHGGGMITREELDTEFDKINAAGLCLIFDCCLSGNLVDPKIIPGWNDCDGFLNEFPCGLEGDNRVVLMSTLKYGLGFSDSINEIYFSRFVAEALTHQLDYNHDGFCSAEEIFTYSRDNFYPYAYEMLLYPLMQIFSLMHSGFFILAFPTLYDTYTGDLPIVNIPAASTPE